MKRLLNIFILMCCSLSRAYLYAGDSLPLLKVPPSGELIPDFSRDVQYFFDQKARYRTDQNGLLRENFTLSQDRNWVLIGHSQGLLWQRFRVDYNFQTQDNLYLFFRQNSGIKKWVYLVQGDKLQPMAEFKSGLKEGRGVPEVFTKLRAQGPGPHEFLVAFDSQGLRLGGSFRLLQEEALIGQMLYPIHSIKGFFYGTAFAFFIIHFLMILHYRDQIYLWYLGYIAAQVAFFAIFDCYLDAFLPIQSPGGWGALAGSAGALVAICLTAINASYFNLKARHPLLYRLFTFSIYLYIGIILIGPLLNNINRSYLVDAAMIWGMFLLLSSSAYVWAKGFHLAKYIFFSRVFFVSCIGLFYLHQYGLIADNVWLHEILRIGCFGEMLTISYGLARRMQDLDRARSKAETAEKEASFKLEWFNTLVRVITHDMATPISVVGSSVEMELRKPQPSASFQRNLERVQRAVKQQTNLINHVRDMIAVASGKKQLEMSPLAVQEVLRDCVQILSERAEAKGVELKQEWLEETVYIKADATSLLNSVFDNFLSNAIKFSQRGQKIIIRLEADAKEVRVHFIDQGIGIPPDLLANLFNPALATSRPGTEREAGTGFGLPLAKTYMDQFQARILVLTRTADDAKNGPTGTQFILCFPRFYPQTIEERPALAS